MAEILGIGLSHYPGPLVPDKYWPSMLARNVKVGRIPQAIYDDKEAWPAGMRSEWGSDDGVSAAAEHKVRLLAGYQRLRREIDAFAPDLIVVWGDDQYENFKKDCVPAFCVYIFDQVSSHPFVPQAVPFLTQENTWGVPADDEMIVRGHRQGARGLCGSLLADGFDVAYAYETRHVAGLAHSFNNTVLFLDMEREGFPYPVVPFHVNCYGNQLMETAADASGEAIKERSPPAPSPRRCFDIGRATAQYFRQSPWRVALIASSSWSHGSLTRKHHRLYPDLDADRARRDELERGEFARWRDLDLQQMEDAGQNEFLNWVCLAGAMHETGQQGEVVDFVESYLFNSSKCFAVFFAERGGMSCVVVSWLTSL